jgi:prevent-host-death family protein
MDRVTIRQLRNDVSRIVRRAQSGERLIITSNGVAVAEIRPLEEGSTERTIQQLIAEGKLIAPTRTGKPPRASPMKVDGPSTEEILDELRQERL